MSNSLRTGIGHPEHRMNRLGRANQLGNPTWQHPAVRRRDHVSRLTTKYVPKTQVNCIFLILVPAKRYMHTRAENKHGYRQQRIPRVFSLDTHSARFGRYSYLDI